MARKKQVEEVELTVEQRKQKALDSWLDFSRTDVRAIAEPDWHFAVGDSVSLGNLENCIVTDVMYGGKAYMLEHDTLVSSNRYDKTLPKYPRGYHIGWWYEILAIKNTSEAPRLFEKELRGRSATSGMDSLLHTYGAGGLVCDPEYQRGYVWSDFDKEQLIQSVFERLEIGSFTLVRYHGYLHKDPTLMKAFKSLGGEDIVIPMRDNYLTAIIDGQQRLTTLIGFMMNKITYKGKKFTDLHWLDRHEFKTFNVQYRLINEEEVSRAEVLKMFLQANRGVPQSPEHLQKVRDLYQAELVKC